FGPLAWEVAELGIGTNDRAAITGNILEDEKVASTVHVAFGNNATIGGVTEVASHHDGVIRTATLELDGRPVLTDGNFLLQE
ncbi:MAG: aminopeptidase, partial [Actinomycetota bacterium]